MRNTRGVHGLKLQESPIKSLTLGGSPKKESMKSAGMPKSSRNLIKIKSLSGERKSTMDNVFRQINAL